MMANQAANDRASSLRAHRAEKVSLLEGHDDSGAFVSDAEWRVRHSLKDQIADIDAELAELEGAK